MKIALTPHEARIIGVLLEKEITTPEQYPLSLNALTNACNQKSNRDPVLELSEATVQQTLDGLVKRYLVSRASGFGSRVSKYQHRFCNTEFGELKLSPQQLAIVCELLLRGPQTPGELRSHGERLCGFDEVQQVETALEALMAREEPLVAKLPREPGKRESRYRHCFFEDMERARGGTEDFTEDTAAPVGDPDKRLLELEEKLAALATELQQVKQRLTAIESDLGMERPPESAG